jgi:hypothetical protein
MFHGEGEEAMSHDCLRLGSLVLLTALLASPALAEGGVTFQDIATDGGSGLVYERVPSARNAISDAIAADGILDVPTEYPASPYKPHGAPGVVVFDYDNDGDLDLYVTNGPGAANSLFTNQLHQTGHLTFLDLAGAAGVAAAEQDSQGACAGDIDNDGDRDLMVLGSGESNLLFENQGDGAFDDITAISGAGGLATTSVSCSMGDVDNDGLLDIFVANTFDFETTEIFVTGPPFVFEQHNQLLLNQGGNVFTDVSETSGIKAIQGAYEPGSAMVTWGATLVDFDLDGDLDIINADDSRAIPFFLEPNGFIRFFRNDGTGSFTDATFEVGMNRFGSWRGISFGDLNCDRRLDLFAPNFGDYVFFPGSFPAGTWASRWFLQRPNGTFADPGPGDLVTTPTGWGNSIADYDNDGDLDIIYHGGQELSLFWDESNPGVILQNQGCTAEFTWDQAALADSTDHTGRNVEGTALGDLNRDGFVDIVSVASFDLTPEIPLLPIFSNPLGSVFDPEALFVPTYVPTDNPDAYAWQGFVPAPGSLSVEVNSGGNGNRWAEVEVLGTVGLTQRGKVNRDGIGAVVTFLPVGGKPVSKPVLGGSSYASQDSIELLFGLGTARRGMVEVLWPGGVRNRFYGVKASDRVVFPEIPCSFEADWDGPAQYITCVAGELNRLRRAGVIDNETSLRFYASAIRAYIDELVRP